MNILFIHQNFPGQYVHLASYMGARAGNTVVCIGEESNIVQRGTLPGVTTLAYQTPQGAGPETHHYLQSTEAAVRRGQAVARVLLEIREKGFIPAVVCAHPGWGEALFVRDVFPRAAVLMFCEYYFHAGQADLQFDPEFTYTLDFSFSVRIRNSAQLISLATADAFVSPMYWQALRYPHFMQQDMTVIHDGINCAYMAPDDSAALTLQPLSTPGESRVLSCSGASAVDDQPAVPEVPPTGGAGQGVPAGPPLVLRRTDKVITYIGRNLEPYRGIHVFLRALPEIQQRHPDAHILIVGADGTSYSPALPEGETYKARYLKEVGARLDFSKIHFLGRIAYPHLRALFRISSVHVYLTYPFVLSWSVLEAMACGCLVAASRTPPVEEVIQDGKNGLLLDFFDRQGLVDLMDAALSRPESFAPLRRNARQTVVDTYELENCLTRHVALLHQVYENKRKKLAQAMCGPGF